MGNPGMPHPVGSLRYYGKAGGLMDGITCLGFMIRRCLEVIWREKPGDVGAE